MLQLHANYDIVYVVIGQRESNASSWLFQLCNWKVVNSKVI